VRIVFAFLFATISSIVQAQQPRVDRIDVIERGIYNAEVTKRVDAPGTPGGTISEVTNIRHVRTTTTIPAQLGVSFGYRYRIVGKPDGASVDLRFVTLIPVPGVRDPKTGNTILHGEYSRPRILGSESVRSYGLRQEWELVLGTWTLEVWQGDRKLASQSFTVVKP
jgi:Domain of unknown function (DUF3859)